MRVNGDFHYMAICWQSHLWKEKRAPKKLSSLAVTFFTEEYYGEMVNRIFFSDQKRKVSWQTKPVRCFFDTENKSK